MFETPITVVGNIVTKPDRKRVGDQELIKFRVASNSRRRTADGNWEPGNSFFVTVNCWGRLVTGVGAALGKGDPVIVVGYVYTSEYEDREGVRRSSVEVRATAVGRISRGASPRIDRPKPAPAVTMRRSRRPIPSDDEPATTPMTTESDEDRRREGLPLSA